MAAPRSLHWDQGPAVSTASAEYSLETGGPIIHRRHVICSSKGYWLILDDFLGGGEHECELQFLLAPGEPPLVEGNRVTAQRSWGCLDLLNLDPGFAPSLATGQLEPLRGWCSTAYGSKEPAPSIRFSRSAAFPLRSITLLAPRMASEAPAQAALTMGEVTELAVRSERFLEFLRIRNLSKTFQPPFIETCSGF